MITKRVIPCLYVKDNKVVKSVGAEELSGVPSPVALAQKYSEGGADELMFYNSTPLDKDRIVFTQTLKEVARSVFIPLTVGGGIRKTEDFEGALACGADKVSVNTGALQNPALVEEAAKKYGDQCVVISVDVRRVKGEFHVFTQNGGVDTGLDGIEWIKRCVGNGAGEVVVNSLDTDGCQKGFDIELLKKVCAAVKVPVIASGGAGDMRDFVELFTRIPDIDAGLAASVFHLGKIEIGALKERLTENNINVRKT